MSVDWNFAISVAMGIVLAEGLTVAIFLIGIFLLAVLQAVLDR